MTDLNKLNTNDLVSHLSNNGNSKETSGIKKIDIKKLIQQKTMQKKNVSSGASLNFNEIPQTTEPLVQKVQSEVPRFKPQIRVPAAAPTPAPAAVPSATQGPQQKLSSNQRAPSDDDNFEEDDAELLAMLEAQEEPTSPSEHNSRPRNSRNPHGGDEDEDEDEDEEEDEDEDDRKSQSKHNGNGNGNGNGNIILQDTDTKNSKPQKSVKDVKLPPNINFGLDQIVNKNVLGAISEDDDDDNKPAQKMFQKKSGYGAEDELDFPEDEDEDEDEDERPNNSKKPLANRPKIVLNRSEIPTSKSQTGKSHPEPNEFEDEFDGNDDLNEDDFEDPDGDDNGDGNGDGNADRDGDGEPNDEDDDGPALNLGGESEDDSDKPRKSSRKMSRHELHVAKRKELTKIERLEKKGYKPCKKFSMADNYDDMVADRERMEDDKGCDESIKWQRKFIMGSSTGIEHLNKVYDPFDIQLDGWSESVYENIGEYDEVFEELYHKYKNKVKIAPEIKLLGMFAGSALMFHFSKTLFSKASDQVPGFEDIMRDNPTLKTAYEQAALQKMNLNNNKTNNPMSSMIGNFFGNNMVGNMLGGLMGNAAQQRPQQQQPPPQQQQQQYQPQQSYQPPQLPYQQSQQQPQQQPQQQQQQQRPPVSQQKLPTVPQQHQRPPHVPPQAKSEIAMDGPSGVDDLLMSLTKGTNADLTELQLSDVDTEGTLSDIGSNIQSVSFANKRTTKVSNRPKRLNMKV
jgi:hypothetical protein